MAGKKSSKLVVKKSKSEKSKKTSAVKLNLSQIKLCPECASDNIFYSKMRDEIVCRDCGGIFSELTPEQMKKFQQVKGI